MRISKKSACCATMILCLFTAVRICAAQPDESQASPEAVAAYTRAANLQNNEAYDLAADAWSNFLAKYPDDVRAVDARYYLGVCQIQLNKLDEARRSLQAVVQADVKFDRLEDAYLNLGWTLYSLGQKGNSERLQESAQVFDQMLRRFREGKQRDQALFLLGESLYLQGQHEQAVQAYRRLVDQHAKSTFRPDAYYALGVAYEELDRNDEAGQVYDAFLTEFADHALVTEVKMRKAECVLRAGDFADAERRFAEVASAPDFASADRALYRQAFSVARQDRFADAGGLFARLVRDFPESDFVENAVMAAARSFYRAEKPSEAAEWFDRVLKKDGPNTIEAAHWRARLWLKQKQPGQALRLVEDFLPRASDHAFLVNLKMDQADALYEIKDRRAESLALYRKIVEQHPDHEVVPQAAYNAAYAAMELGDFAQGLQLSQQWLQKYPRHRLVNDVKNVAAECHLQLGHNDDAAKLFAELASVERGESSRWKIREALALYAQQDYERSLQRLAAHIDALTTPDDLAEAHHLRGMNHLALRQFDAAEKDFRASLQVNPKWSRVDEVLLNLSKAQRGAGKLEQARKTVARLGRDYPDSAVQDRAIFRAAEYAYAAGDYADAIRQYADLLARFPQSNLAPIACYGSGWSHLRSKQFAEAIQDFTRLIDQFEDHALVRQALYARGMSRQQAGRFDASMKDIQQFLQAKPDRQETSDALYVLGLCQVGQEEFAKAIQTFQSVVDQHPTYNGMDKVLYELAWANKFDGKSGEAQRSFVRLTEQFPDSSLSAEAHYHVGEAAYEQKDYENAAQSYGLALGRCGENRELGEKAGYKLGWSYYQLDDFTKAAKAFAQQLKMRPTGTLAGDGIFMLGESHFHQGDFKTALEFYTKASSRSLSSDVIVVLTHLHAGQAAAQLKMWKESLDWLEKIAVDQPKSTQMPQIQFEMAVAQQNLGNLELALKLFASVADASQSELAARARFMKGELHYAKKDYVQAIREFREVMFGFDQKTVPEVARWQAKAGFEAGQCAGVLASQQQDRDKRDRFVDLAKKFFEYVRASHPASQEAEAAAQQLKKYGA